MLFIALKRLWNRTWLTLLSIIGVALAVGLVTAVPRAFWRSPPWAPSRRRRPRRRIPPRSDGLHGAAPMARTQAI